MTEELWTDVERRTMEKFKEDVRNKAKPDKQFDTVKEGMNWMKAIRN